MDKKIQFIRSVVAKTLDNDKIPNRIKHIINDIGFHYCEKLYNK